MSPHRDRQLPENDRILDLLAAHATEGLDDADLHELQDMLADNLRVDELDLAAASIDAATVMRTADDVEQPPKSVTDALAALAARWDAGEREFNSTTNTTPLNQAAPRYHSNGSVDTTPPRPAPRYTPAPFAVAGWLVAAASLLLAAIAWWPSSSPPGITTPTAAEELAVLQTTPGTITADWSGGPDAPDTTGEVIWNADEQRGYMTFEGLPANDPNLEQYQLWIFDADRPTGDLPQHGQGILSQRPVDGGVFDIANADVDENGTVIVPIQAKLPVGHAAAFAVTIEKPGGVVVSSRERVASIAVVDNG